MFEKILKLPKRTQKARNHGLSMVMDKGLSVNDAKNLISVASNHIDIIKLGFGTSLFTNNIKEKIKLYQKHEIKVYLGGTLFEAFIVQNKFKEYKSLLLDLNLKMVEVSDGCTYINHEDKCRYINELSKNFKVVSEVGSKNESTEINIDKWISQMQLEIKAGSWKVIAEARESGNVGVFNKNGNVKSSFIQKICDNINVNNIIWEAPVKNQQAWFIKNLGTNVNIGNINPSDIIPLECLRVGLRGDTFDNFIL